MLDEEVEMLNIEGRNGGKLMKTFLICIIF